MSRKEEEDLDSLARATEMKRHQGLHEIEVSFGGEGDLRRALILCDKNPGHVDFINIKEFNIEHLPREYQDSDIVDMVRAIGDITVRLSVKGISQNRPEFFDDNKRMRFPFYEDRGKSDVMMTGTGWVSLVVKFSEEDKDYCECNKCVSSDTPKKIRGFVVIFTAAHVVSDDIEAANTTALFFYDDGEADVNKLLKLTGFKHVGCIIKDDMCYMFYSTHDMELLDKLDKMWRRRDDLDRKLIHKYKMLDKKKGQSCTGKSRDLDDAIGRLSVCVSHPHGQAKTVTVGKVLDTQTVEGRYGDQWTQYIYDCCSCKGSSGSSIFILGDDGGRWLSRYGESHSHSGGEKTDEGNRNFSNIGWLF